MWFLLLAMLISQSDSNGSSLDSLSSPQAALLTQWYDQLGEPESEETFGDFLARAASVKRLSPYRRLDESTGSERLRIDLNRFDCLSFIDTSMAVARCRWMRDPTEACFVRELIATRYRHGVMKDFASRLHYLEEWLDDNRSRHRLDDLTRDLGGVLLRRRFDYMSAHRSLYAPLADPIARQAIELTEAQLSQRIYAVIVRPSVRKKAPLLQNGDLVGIVTTDPGRLLGHAGIVVRDGQGRVQLLHASSHRRRVVVTSTSLADYVLRREERWGIMVARPRSPGTSSLGR
jgi:hypothetical protein